jgi:hypothetical protein
MSISWGHIALLVTSWQKRGYGPHQTGSRRGSALRAWLSDGHAVGEELQDSASGWLTTADMVLEASRQWTIPTSRTPAL